MQGQILKLIDEKFTKTHGGCSLIELGLSLKIEQPELKYHLNALYKENKILVRKGINQKLIYPYGK